MPTLSELQEKRELARGQDGVAAIATLREILTTLQTETIEGEPSEVESLELDVVTELAAAPIGGDLEAYPEWMERGTASIGVDEMRSRADSGRAVAADELEAWATKWRGEAEKRFKREGSIFFAEGGFPLIQSARGYVAWQKSCLAARIEGLFASVENDGSLALQVDPANARTTFETSLQEAIDGVSGLLSAADVSTEGFMSVEFRFFSMVNVTNMVNQIVVGKLFQLIGGVVGGVVKALTETGRGSWVVKASQTLGNARKKMVALRVFRPKDWEQAYLRAEVEAYEAEQLLRGGARAVAYDATRGSRVVSIPLDDTTFVERRISGMAVERADDYVFSPGPVTRYAEGADDVTRMLETERLRVYQLEEAVRTGELKSLKPGTQVWIIDDAGQSVPVTVPAEGGPVPIPTSLEDVQYVRYPQDFQRQLDAARVRLNQLETAKATGTAAPEPLPAGTRLVEVPESALAEPGTTPSLGGPSAEGAVVTMGDDELARLIEREKLRVYQLETAVTTGELPTTLKPGTEVWIVDDVTGAETRIVVPAEGVPAIPASPEDVNYMPYAMDYQRQLDSARVRLRQLEVAAENGGEIPTPMAPGTRLVDVEEDALKYARQEGTEAPIGGEGNPLPSDYEARYGAPAGANMEPPVSGGEAPTVGDFDTIEYLYPRRRITQAERDMIAAEQALARTPGVTPSEDLVVRSREADLAAAEEFLATVRQSGTDLRWLSDLAYEEAAIAEEVTSLGIGPHTARTTMWGLGLGATGALAKIESEISAKLTPKLGEIVERVAGTDVAGVDSSAGLEEVATAIFQKHEAEFRTELEAEATQIGETLETDIEIPLTEEEAAESADEAWWNQVRSLWEAMQGTSDYGIALQMWGQMSFLCAAPPLGLEGDASGVMALAEDLLQRIFDNYMEMAGARYEAPAQESLADVFNRGLGGE